MKKTLLIIILLFGLLFNCNQPVASSGTEDTTFFDVSEEPIQINHNGEPSVKYINQGELMISPLAKYRLAGVVKSTKNYSSGWESQISPVDLAIVWGKLTLPEYDRYMSYSQNGRWYYYRYKGGFPESQKYIIQHSSNNHILPANENVWAAARSIKKNQEVMLEGYLVWVKGIFKGKKVWWKSSLTRKDTGDHSCEVFFVNKIITKGKIYQ